MSFFDTKEEILQVELTQLGKYLLFNGKFDPKYYAFYDDDVIYDLKYTNLTESQNTIETRILKNTPISKQSPNLFGREKELLTNNEVYFKPSLEYNLSNDLLTNYLASCDFNSEYAPAWMISLNSGSVLKSYDYNESSTLIG